MLHDVVNLSKLGELLRSSCILDAEIQQCASVFGNTDEESCLSSVAACMHPQVQHGQQHHCFLGCPMSLQQPS